MYWDAVISNLPQLEKTRFSKSWDTTRPVVFSDIIPGWKAAEKWSLPFFKTSFGTCSIIAEKIVNGKYFYKNFTLSDFIEYAYEPPEERPFHARTTIHLTNGLINDYDGEVFFPCWYKQWHRERTPDVKKIELSDIFIGPKSSYSHLHIDIWGTSFWNALFEGKKLWLFFDKEQVTDLYDGLVDPFNPDFEKYPRFSNIKPTVWVQEPGELIYCPGNVYHAVYAMETCLALSENFIDSTNYMFVLESFKKSGFERAYEKMLAIKNCYG